jgi:hypothetical protein
MLLGSHIYVAGQACGAPPIPDGATFYVVNEAHGGYATTCMDLRAQDVEDNAGRERIQQNGCNYKIYQQFRFGDRDSDQCYLIEALGSTVGGKAAKYVTADAADQMGAVDPSPPSEPAFYPMTRWTVAVLSNNPLRVRLVNRASGWCVDRPTEASNPGDRLQQKPCNGNLPGQIWLLQSAKMHGQGQKGKKKAPQS